MSENRGVCDACHAEILWAMNADTDRSMQLHPKPDPKGTHTLEPASDGSLVAYPKGKGTAPLLDEELFSRHRCKR